MDTKVCRVCVSVCVCEKERKREAAFPCSRAQWFSQFCLVWSKLQSRLHFQCWPSVFPRKEEPSHGSQGAEEKVRSREWDQSGRIWGNALCPCSASWQHHTTVAGLALSPPGSPISILPSVSKSCLWPSTPSLWVFSFLKVLLGEISRNYLIEGRNLISNKQGWIDNRYHLPSLANKPGSSHILTNPFGWVFIDSSTDDETAVQRVWVCYSVWHSS